MISVSAGHQFAVNRWNPGYTGGKTGPGQGAQGGSKPMSQGMSQVGSKVPGAEQTPSQGVGSGGIFVLFIFSCTKAPSRIFAC